MSYVANIMNRNESSAVKNDFKSTYTNAARCVNSQVFSKVPLPIFKNVTISPVSKAPNGSSQIISPNIKRMEPLLCQSKEQFIASNSKISKEITISPINDIEKSKMLLKKLPDITFCVVNPKPVFKVPESPKLNPKKMNGSNNNSKAISESKVLSERQNGNIIINKNKNSKIFNTENLAEKNTSFQESPQCKRKLVQNIFDDITTLTKNNYNTIISKIPKKYSYSEVKNTIKQKTSSPNKLPKKSLSFPNIKSKNLTTIKPAKKQKISNNPTDSINNNIDNKTHKSVKDYLLMDLSNENKINIVPASPSSEFLNVSLPKYDSFAMGISEPYKESSMHLETSQNYFEKQEFPFSNNRDYVNSSPSIDKFLDVPIVSQSVSAKESVPFPLDSLKTDEVYVNMKQIETEQKPNSYFDNVILKPSSHQDNNINHTTGTSIISEDNQLQQEMRSHFCDNLIENTTEILLI